MPPKRVMAWLMVAALSTTLVAAPKQTPHNTKASSGEPFRSFRMLDAKLSLLTNQQEALKAAFNPVQSPSGRIAAPSGRRTEAARSMNFTAAGIGGIARRLERLYEQRHQRFGVQTFRVIRIKAEEVQRAVSAVTKAETRGALHVSRSRACGSVFQGLTVVQGSSVRVSGGRKGDKYHAISHFPQGRHEAPLRPSCPRLGAKRRFIS